VYELEWLVKSVNVWVWVLSKFRFTDDIACALCIACDVAGLRDSVRCGKQVCRLRLGVLRLWVNR